jgi:hypothetical protein
VATRSGTLVLAAVGIALKAVKFVLVFLCCAALCRQCGLARGKSPVPKFLPYVGIKVLKPHLLEAA